MDTLTALPNLHPALVHLPIALALAALGFDFAALAAHTQRWLDWAAAALYAAAATGALAAYLSGRAAEDGLAAVPAAVEPLIASHADWALRTLLALGLLALSRIWTSWRSRGEPGVRLTPTRFALAVLAAFAAASVLVTADKGGALVYRHGVAVTRPSAPPSEPAQVQWAGQPAPTGPAGSLRETAGGALDWQPLAGDLAAPRLLRPAAGEEAAVRLVAEPDGGEGLALAVTGLGLLLLPAPVGDARTEAVVDLRGFKGTIGLAHHVRSPSDLSVFELRPDSTAALVGLHDGGRRELGRGRAHRGSFATIAVSVAGTHLKGYVDGRTVAHGHGDPGVPGQIGLLFDGEGTVRLRSLKVEPLPEHP
jgi:uncharacterized membrane protein